LHTTIEQKLIVLDVDEAQVDGLVADVQEWGLSARPSTFRRQTMACTGIEFCKLAIVDTKVRAARVIEELERRLPGFDQPITINFNGCPNSCARIQTGDIGLRGQLVTRDDGSQVEGFQIQLGGGLSADEGFGRKVRGLRQAAEDLPDYLERLIRRFDAERTAGETFGDWVRRADQSALM
jgi:sulfite reductase (ferredoxin)